jgi:multisubunit Na+/H+ antiporter MnhG subunit
MKYKYCPSCDKTYVKSRLEGDKCVHCGKVCEVRVVKKNALYYIGYAILILGAIIVFLYREFNDALLWVIFILILVSGGTLIMVGSTKMARQATEIGRAEKQQEDDDA